MADEKLLELLNQGASAWNDWRIENANAPIDLRGAELTKANLLGANFFMANLREADFRDANRGCKPKPRKFIKSSYFNKLIESSMV